MVLHGTVGPNQPAKRLDVMLMLCKFMGLQLVSDTEADQILAEFLDGATTPLTARRYIATLIKAKLVLGDTVGNLNLMIQIKRSEFATLILRLIE